MRRALRIIFSRYGIVAIILLLVFGVIALTQTPENTPLDGTDAPSRDSTERSEGFTADDGLATEDCGGDDCYAEEELPTEAVDRAMLFAQAWINPNDSGAEDWYNSIAPYLTTDHAELMQGVDPQGVPAESITGEAEAEGSKIRIPMDTGTLILRMTEGSNSWTGNDWLVSSIDWEQA